MPVGAQYQNTNTLGSTVRNKCQDSGWLVSKVYYTTLISYRIEKKFVSLTNIEHEVFLVLKML